jgi:hypothetical protein
LVGHAAHLFDDLIDDEAEMGLLDNEFSEMVANNMKN